MVYECFRVYYMGLEYVLECFQVHVHFGAFWSLLSCETAQTCQIFRYGWRPSHGDIELIV